jgi:hypothetical protein
MFLKNKGNTCVEVPSYHGVLKEEVLVDYIDETKHYFEYKIIEGPQRIKFIVVRLKGHVTSW